MLRRNNKELIHELQTYNEQLEEKVHERTQEIEKQKEIIEEAKAQSDALLLNIMPEEIADELKKYGKSYARKYDQVSVLFADIKGFTSIAEKLTPVKLVTLLDEMFGAFDNITAKYGMEKIKTIGDAYMCASGLPQIDNENPVKSVKAALDMLHFIKEFGAANKIQNLPVFEIRIGIHTGPLVAGVVGHKKFAYDIWGDAVNLASRLEQYSEAGKLNISGETYNLIKEHFDCTHRGKIETKSKGLIDMYFVDKIKS